MEHPFRIGMMYTYVACHSFVIRIWVKQLSAWLAVVSISKMMVLSVLVANAEWIGGIGVMLFAPLDKLPMLQLIIVMVIIPCSCNLVQFWVQDSFLMWHHNREKIVEDPLKESLLPHANITVL